MLRFKSKKNIIKKITLISILILLGIITTSYNFSEKINRNLSEKLIRLHVIANSDTDEDQTMKLEIRDKILLNMQKALKNNNSKHYAELYIKENLSEFESIAKKVVKEYNKDYSVSAKYGEFAFPTKEYGDIALPSGYYQALRVEVGKSEGKNWWCVMFPPLCFVDATTGELSDEVKSELKEILSEEEYLLINETENEGELPVKVKFKIVELVENSKIEFTGLLKKIFK